MQHDRAVPVAKPRSRFCDAETDLVPRSDISLGQIEDSINICPTSKGQLSRVVSGGDGSRESRCRVKHGNNGRDDEVVASFAQGLDLVDLFAFQDVF